MSTYFNDWLYEYNKDCMDNSHKSEWVDSYNRECMNDNLSQEGYEAYKQEQEEYRSMMRGY